MNDSKFLIGVKLAFRFSSKFLNLLKFYMCYCYRNQLLCFFQEVHLKFLHASIFFGAKAAFLSASSLVAIGNKFSFSMI